MLMSDAGVGRRQLLRGAGVAAGGAAITGIALAAPAMANGDDGGHGGRLAGSWLGSRQDDPSPDDPEPEVVSVVLSFGGGNVFITKDNLPAGPPFTGTWARVGRRGFRATFWSGFPGGPPDADPPEPPVAVVVHLSGRLEGGTLTGTYSGDVLTEINGTPVFSFTGSLTAQPIEA
jgi:hypothetical protein